MTLAGSLIHPKVVRSVHYCPATKKTMERRYTDMTSLDARPSSGIYPTKVSLHGKEFYGMMISLGEGAGLGGSKQKESKLH